MADTCRGTTPFPLFARSPRTPETLALRIGRALGDRRYNAALAALLGVPLETARSYVAGRRSIPAYRMEIMAGRLRSHASAVLSLALETEHFAREINRRGRRNSGFCVVKVRDASGVPRDGRWRGGRPSTASARTPPS